MGHLVMNYVRIDGVPAKSKAISPARFITFFVSSTLLTKSVDCFPYGFPCKTTTTTTTTTFLLLFLHEHHHHHYYHISVAFRPQTLPPPLSPHFYYFPSTETTNARIFFFYFPSPPPPPPHTLLLLSHHHQIDHHIFISLHPLALVTTTATKTFLLFSLLPKELFFFLSYSLIVAPLP